MNALEEYDRKHERDCLECINHVTRNNGNLHFCKDSGKILLYPLYLPSKCEKWKGAVKDEQCYKADCRYNTQGQCADNPNYKECVRVIKQVLGEDRYNSFLEWEKLENKRKGAVKDE